MARELENGERFKEIRFESRYSLKIKSAKSLFSQEVTYPDLYFVPGLEIANAGCIYKLKIIVFAERLIRDYDVDDVAAILAHEISHLEENQRSGSDLRPHWMVDARAVELVGRLRVLKALKRIREDQLSFRRRMIPEFFILAYLAFDDAEIDDRIKRLEEP